MEKRKRSQLDRDEKLAKKLAKLRTKRGQKKGNVQQSVPDSNAELDEKHVDMPVPAFWNCSINDAVPGTFGVLEVLYDKPKRRGIAVVQVHLCYGLSCYLRSDTLLLRSDAFLILRSHLFFR